MFDDIDPSIGVFDFDELADHLLEQGLEASPSTLHGCLCGLLAAGAPAEPEAGLALLQADSGKQLSAIHTRGNTVDEAGGSDGGRPVVPATKRDQSRMFTVMCRCSQL